MWRNMGHLHVELKDVLADWELELLPRGFERIGHVAIVSIPLELHHRLDDVARALLRIKGIRTVALREGIISGRKRRPNIKVIRGDPTTETIHKENGCDFKLDVAKVMFSSGNLYERARLPRLVADGEVVVDLFAGVGQFTIPIAKHAKPRKVYSIEINPIAYGYLLQNVRMNYVGHIVEPLMGDCLEVAPRGVADRVIMGLLHVTHQYLPLALEVLRPTGGIIHYHESVPSKIRFERPVKRLLEVALGRKIRILQKRVVKRYAPGVDHVVVDAKVEPDLA